MSRTDDTNDGGGGVVHVSDLPQNPEQVEPLERRNQIKSAATAYLAEVKSAFRNTLYKYQEFQTVMRSMKFGKISKGETTRRLMVLFEGHPELVVGFNYLMPRENIDTEKATVELIRKIENKFLDYNPAGCRFLVKELNKLIEGEEFDYDRKLEVATLLQGHPDLLVDFLSVLASCDGFVSISDIQCTPVNDVKPRELNPVVALPVQLPCIDDGMMVDSVTEKLSNSDSDRRDGDSDCPSGSGTSADACVDDVEEKFSPSPPTQRQEPDQELDPSTFDICTPGYRFLPENFPVASSIWRNEIAHQVLNDQCISFNADTEYRRFKQRNPHEEILFRCEDDMYELDMLIETLKATTQHVEALLEMINNQMTETNCSISIHDHLKPMDLRCIGNLYGESADDVLYILRKDPVTTLPIILRRLKQKQEESVEHRRRFKQAWARAFNKSHLKSLDVGYNRSV